MNLLEHILNQTTPSQTQGTLANGTTWRYLAEGVMVLTPKVYHKKVLLSAGIHGNETAPMELLRDLCFEIFQGLPLGVELMLIFGNPNAIRQNVRYVENDINRLFVGRHQTVAGDEAVRASELEKLVAAFFGTNSDLQKWHYDLHTAIRPSLMPRFALLPKSDNAYNADLLDSLNTACMDAIVYHQTKSTTFSQFSQSCGADSVTLELGKVMPFGCNDLSQFLPSYEMLKTVVMGQPPAKSHHQAKEFVIDDIIIKRSEHFRLCVDSNLPNFSQINAKQVLAYDEAEIDGKTTTISYQYDEPRFTLFLNASVKVGLRAGMLMRQINHAN